MAVEEGASNMGMGPRFAAAWVDIMLVYVATFFGELMWWVARQGDAMLFDDRYINGTAFELYDWIVGSSVNLYPVMLILSEAILTSSLGGGQTLGMRMVGIRVVDQDRRAPNLLRSTVRTIAWFVSLMPSGIVLLWIGLDAERRALHDRLTGTAVIDARS